jgi:hypothetical protein
MPDTSSVPVQSVAVLNPTTILATDDKGRLWMGQLQQIDGQPPVTWTQLNAPDIAVPTPRTT